METRKITIANTRDQKKSVVMTAATTLGELKRDLDAAGINYSEMDFIEALTKTQLRGDDSVLPHDVPYNHTTTNELVFLLTVPNRKIKSGSSRLDVYNRILNCDDSEELKDAIIDHFGMDYSMVMTSDLEDFLNVWDDDVHHVHHENHCEMTLEERVAELERRVNNLQNAMMEVIDTLEEDYFTTDIYNALTHDCKPKDNTVYSAGMSSDDIDELVSNI